MQKVIVNCAHCGAELERTQSRAKAYKNHFCNKKHYYEWRNGKLFRQVPPKVIVTCTGCGKEFEKHPCLTVGREKHYCTMKCRKNKAKRTCDQCGKIVERNASAMQKDFIFCSRECNFLWKSEHQSGENNRNWKGGYKNYYGPNWRAQRRAARKRDNHTCQMCGKTKYEVGKELDVHHKIPFRDFNYIRGENDNYLQANHLDNLITLCKICHLKTEPQ